MRTDEILEEINNQIQESAKVIGAALKELKIILEKMETELESRKANDPL